MNKLALAILPLTLIAIQASAVDATAELLAKKGVITAEEYAQLKAAEAEKASLDTSQGLKFLSADKATSAQLGTLLQMDYASYDGNLQNSQGRDVANNGTEFRRIRLYLAGTLDGEWDYRTEVDFAKGAQLVDGYVSYKGWQSFALTAGHFRVPFCQEPFTTDKGLTFMERSLPNAFFSPRAPGLMLSSGREHWSAAAMVFGEQLTTQANALSDEGGGFSTRATWAPLLGPALTLHIGASWMLRVPSQANVRLGDGGYTEGVQFRSTPESDIIETRLVDTGATGITNLEDSRLTGLELGLSATRFLVIADYIDTNLSRRNGKSNLDFSGWSAQASWAITGEGHNYVGSKGLFEGLRPTHATNRGGYGAWEIAVRMSELDLSDGALLLTNGKHLPEINGGMERDLSFALNWYLTNNFRINTNYIKVLDLDGGPYDGKHLNALQLRFQFAY